MLCLAKGRITINHHNVDLIDLIDNKNNLTWNLKQNGYDSAADIALYYCILYTLLISIAQWCVHRPVRRGSEQFRKVKRSKF